MTYVELAPRSSQVANPLLATGIERGDRVGIHLDESIESVGDLLRARAGATCVPLDPQASRATLAHIVADCAVRVLTASRGRRAGRWGGPKGGVMLSHHNALALYRGRPTSSQRASQGARTIGWRTYAPLHIGPFRVLRGVHGGACVVLVRPGAGRFLVEVRGFIEAKAVKVWAASPIYAEHARAGACSDLRRDALGARGVFAGDSGGGP